MGETGRDREVPPDPLGRTVGVSRTREAESAGRPRGQAALTQQQSRAGLAVDGKPEWEAWETAQCDSVKSGPPGYLKASCLRPWALKGSDTTL